MLWLARVKRSRRISHLLLSNSLVVATAELQPTPLCHIAYVTFDCPFGSGVTVKPAKKRRSTSVSINSSARGFASSNSCCFSSAASFLSSCASSNMTSVAMTALRVLLLLVPQKKRSSQEPRLSFSYK